VKLKTASGSELVLVPNVRCAAYQFDPRPSGTTNHVAGGRVECSFAPHDEGEHYDATRDLAWRQEGSVPFEPGGQLQPILLARLAS